MNMSKPRLYLGGALCVPIINEIFFKFSNEWVIYGISAVAGILCMETFFRPIEEIEEKPVPNYGPPEQMIPKYPPQAPPQHFPPRPPHY